VDALNRLVASWSNNGGNNWSSALPYAETGATPTWALDAANENLLHSVYRATSGGVKYQALTIARDASNNVTGISTTGSAIVLDGSAYAQLPSLTMDKNGRPAVAWSYAGTGGEAKWEVRFLRAAGDPAVGTNWKNAQGTSTSPDVLGQRLVAGVSGSASLQRMPPGTPNGTNDDALYLFWQEDDSDQLRWSKAGVAGASYAAWSAPTVKASVVASTSGVATAVDWRNRGIVVHYHNTGDERNRMYRKNGLDDSETTLWTATQVWGTQVSFGIDRGDIYVYYKKANGNVARLSYLPGPPTNGWETSETIIATATNSYPSARQDLGNGEGNVAWARVNGVGGWDLKVEPFTTSRPFINRFAVIPSAFDPSVGETTTVSYFLKDASSTLTVTVRVYDANNTLVRTLVNASQAVGAQSVVWDGKNDAGTVLPGGVYTVRGNATDPLGFEAPEVSAVARIGAINYSYDRLYRLTGVSGAAPATTYSYDPVGNRLSMVRGTTTSYTYDRADRITAAGGVVSSSDPKGNVTGRGSDVFAYDQPNRLTNVTIGGVSSSYTYDGDGKRATRTSGGQTTTYTYDANRSLPVVLDDGGRKYVWGLGLAYSAQGTNVEVYHADGLGSVRAVTDVHGDVTQTYTRDEFGVPTGTQGTSNQPFGFTGEQRDPESGFMYLRARMYEPGIGRFLQRDLTEGNPRNPASINRCVYALNNPATLTDPSGKTAGDRQGSARPPEVAGARVSAPSNQGAIPLDCAYGDHAAVLVDTSAPAAYWVDWTIEVTEGDRTRQFHAPVRIVCWWPWGCVDEVYGNIGGDRRAIPDQRVVSVSVLGGGRIIGAYCGAWRAN
jgi:RHS repeat-associated protein